MSLKEFNKGLMRLSLIMAHAPTIRDMAKNKSYTKEQKKLFKKLISNKEAIAILKHDQQHIIYQIMATTKPQ